MIIRDLAIIVVCMIGQAFFAGMETGVISIHRMRLRHFVKHGAPGAKILEGFLKSPDRLLGTTLVGTNICTVIISVVAAGLAVRLVPGYGSVLSTIVVSALLLIFAEYLPKAWFHSRPIERCRRFSGTLRTTELMLWPLSRALIWMTNWFVSTKDSSFSKPVPFVTKEDLKLLAREGEKDGILSPRERVMIHRVFELSGKSAKDIMISRANITVVYSGTKIPEFLEIARNSRLTRFPVVDRKTDAFVGVVNVFIVLSSGNDNKEKTVMDFIKPPLFIPEEMPGDDIFPRLRRFRQPMAFVHNENKDVQGLITTEDILEEIVGKL
ncbi:MAG: HlyC/CorC family transporter [Kiritimatiellae bacterium]|nr:HlyC/CorC family transporter [Kiritimatiellia bacterium]